MHPFAMKTAAILMHSLNRFSLWTKMAAVAVAKLLLCCDIICKRFFCIGNALLLLFLLQFLKKLWLYGHGIVVKKNCK